MAESRICPNCGAKNPATNRFCEDCGYDMNKASAASKPSAALFCPNGHDAGDTSLGFCDVCGEKLISERPVVKPLEPVFEPKPVEPVVPLTPTHVKKCPSCGAINPEDGVFCEECGKALAKAPIPTVDPEPIVVSHVRPSEKSIPDIPDIMRPMTNNDMKR